MDKTKADETKTASPSRRQNDPERSQANILRVATREFAEHSYDGARMDRIAATAGVSKNLIYHYFGSKDQLFVRVLHDAMFLLREAQADHEIRTLDPIEAMRAHVGKTFTYFSENPDIIRLLITENLLKGRNIVRSPEIIDLYTPLLDTIAELLERGEEDGTFRPGVDPGELYISIAGLCIFYFANRYTMSAAMRSDLSAPERIAQRKQHVIDLILGFLTNRPV